MRALASVRPVLTALVVLALTAPAASAVTAAPTARSGAAGCKDRKCDGVNPDQALCSTDPTVLDSVRATDGVKVDLRLGGNCYAVWARTSSNDEIVIQGSAANDGTPDKSYGLAAGHQYTYMLGFSWHVRACIRAWESNQWSCTAWH